MAGLEFYKSSRKFYLWAGICKNLHRRLLAALV